MEIKNLYIIVFCQLLACGTQQGFTGGLASQGSADAESQENPSASPQKTQAKNSAEREADTSIIFATHIGNPGSNLTATFAIKNKYGETIRIHDARLNVSAIALAATSSNSPGKQLKANWLGPYLWDVISEEVLPEPSTIVLQESRYQRLSFEISANSMQKDTAFVKGTAELEGSEVPFQLALNDLMRFDFAVSGGIPIDAERHNSIAIILETREWFRNTHFAKMIQTNGEVRIGRDSNLAAYLEILANSKNLFLIGKDLNEDGTIEERELLTQRQPFPVKPAPKNNSEEIPSADNNQNDVPSTPKNNNLDQGSNKGASPPNIANSDEDEDEDEDEDGED